MVRHLEVIGKVAVRFVCLVEGKGKFDVGKWKLVKNTEG